MNFEWDEAKRLTNIQKHRLDFRDAAQVMAGDYCTGFAKITNG